MRIHPPSLRYRDNWRRRRVVREAGWAVSHAMDEFEKITNVLERVNAIRERLRSAPLPPSPDASA